MMAHIKKIYLPCSVFYMPSLCLIMACILMSCTHFPPHERAKTHPMIQTTPIGWEAFIIFFPLNSAIIPQTGIETIALITDIMHNNPDITLLITGHTDTSGTRAVNERLSAQRAHAVKKTLLDNNIDPTRITLRAEGQNKPLVQTRDGQFVPKNRRVEILLLHPFPHIQ